MEGLNTPLTISLGLILRLGLPVALTALVIFFLRRLDNRWKLEARQKNQVPVFAASQPCWEIKHCSPEKMERCPAAGQTLNPCWQVFRSAQGTLKENCLGCEVFVQAPLAIGD